mgnify:CR=1 FL=1
MEIPQAYRLHRCNACSGDALQEGAQVGTEHNERSASEQAEGRSPDATAVALHTLPVRLRRRTVRSVRRTMSCFRDSGICCTGSSASLRDNASSALSGIVSCFMFGSI